MAADSVGIHTYGHEHIHVHFPNPNARLTIGKFCSIGAGCNIFLGGNHRTDWVTTFPFGYRDTHIFPHHGQGHPGTKGDVTIGNDVWIGFEVTIMSGVTIGDGAVIAANSHVVKDVAPYTIVGGNPARLIRARFSDEIIAQLLELKWWDLPAERINQLIPSLCSDEVSTLLDELQSPK